MSDVNDQVRYVISLSKQLTITSSCKRAVEYEISKQNRGMRSINGYIYTCFDSVANIV